MPRIHAQPAAVPLLQRAVRNHQYMTAACLDPRLVVAALQGAGVSLAESQSAYALIASMLCGEHALSGELELHVSATGSPVRTIRCGLELQWDCVRFSAPVEAGDPFAVALASAAHAAAEPWASLARQETLDALKNLDERLVECGVTRTDILAGRTALSEPVWDVLEAVWRGSADRILQSEVAPLLTKRVEDARTRRRAGQFIVRVLALPSARTHRFFLCDALENLASPELAPDLAAVLVRYPHDSLRGRWCTVLGKCGCVESAATLAAVARASEEETLVRALTALGELRAKAQADFVETFCEYQGADKEWTAAVRRAARGALKRLQ